MESITIEQRPRIQSCNVFISTKNSTESRDVQLSLKTNAITLNLPNNSFKINLQSFSVIPASLSSLNISDNSISFRLQSSPDATLGTFSTEVIDPQKAQRDNCTVNNLEIQLPPKNTQLSLVCHCCKNTLSNEIIFERVLPLPSDNCDPAEWFCCSHSGDDVNMRSLLHPRDRDFFYGSHYCILNKSTLLDNYKVIDDDVVCNRCLSVLGTVNSTNFGGAIKFWNFSLQFTLRTSPSDYCNRSSPWVDFKAAFSCCVNDDLFNRTIHFLAVEQNRTYLLIVKPMEKTLCLLTEGCCLKMNEVTLDKKMVTKILYRYEKTDVYVNNSDVRVCRISVASIVAGIDNLVLSSLRIPPIYRKVEPDYHVGYIF